MVQVVARPIVQFFAFWLSQNTTLSWSRKRRFNWLHGTNFWTYPKSTWARSRKQYSRSSPDTKHKFSHCGFPNLRLQRGRERDDSRGCLELTRHFIHSGLSKMRLRRGRKTNVAMVAILFTQIFAFCLSHITILARPTSGLFKGLPGTI